MHGKRLDDTDYAGMAIQMGDGTDYAGVPIQMGGSTGISWDGRDVRHNTSIPMMPDGLDGGTPWTCKNFHNYVYGTFAAAKDRIVKAGIRLATAEALDEMEND